MKKLLLSMALLVGIGGAASALTVQDICKKYSYTGEVYQDTQVFAGLSTKDVDGWPMSQMSGAVTIEAATGNNVVVKGLFPNAKDLKAVFDAEKKTLTFDSTTIRDSVLIPACINSNFAEKINYGQSRTIQAGFYILPHSVCRR